MADESCGWHKSSYSNGAGGDCVEVCYVGAAVLIRDSKYLRDPANDPAARPVIALRLDRWPAFCRAACSGGSGPGLPRITQSATGTTLTAKGGIVLSFTTAEWAAFIAGVGDGEFDLPKRTMLFCAESGSGATHTHPEPAYFW